MSIFDKIKRTIFGINSDFINNASTTEASQPKQNLSTSEVSNTPHCHSEHEISTVKILAENLAKKLNDTLYSANKSNNIETRNSELKTVRIILDQLKELESKYTFLHLTNLQAVEACISGVEAETLALNNSHPSSTEEHIEPENKYQQSLNGNEERAILSSIQSQFRVINESIEIAKKSKILETKKSRLKVARETLITARNTANKFALNVDGFDQAETEINSLQLELESIPQNAQTGTTEPYTDSLFYNNARNILMAATALKRENKYTEACDKLREAYSAAGAEILEIEERLRLPMYLLLADKGDEGWDELMRLRSLYVDQRSQEAIANQIRIFCKKEGKNREAIIPSLNKIRHKKEKNLHKQRLDSYTLNSDIVDALRWSAPLDSHNCIECAARDGKTWTNDADHKPIGHSIPFRAPPLHRHCRCMLLPIFKTKDGWQLPHGTRASEIGQIDVNTTMADFIKMRGPAFADKLLGVGRAQLFMSGKLSLDDMLDARGKAMTLRDIKAKHGL